MGLEARELIYQDSKDRLEHMAFRAIKKGLRRDEFIMVAIDVDDSSWTEVVDLLMPGYNWQEIRDRGEKPIARGSAMAAPLLKYLGAVVPDIETALTGPLPERAVRTIVMAEGGASVYFLEPIPHFRDQ
jgi:hypothetical protein